MIKTMTRAELLEALLKHLEDLPDGHHTSRCMPFEVALPFKHLLLLKRFVHICQNHYVEEDNGKCHTSESDEGWQSVVFDDLES